jgi:hypothetical protein
LDAKSNKGYGTLAEAQVIVRLLAMGFGASWAIGDNVAWDLISDWKGTVHRLQVKATGVINERGVWRLLCAHGRKKKIRYTPVDCSAIIAVLPWGMYVIPIERLDHLALTFWPPGEHPRKDTKKFNKCKYEWARERWDLLK